MLGRLPLPGHCTETEGNTPRFLRARPARLCSSSGPRGGLLAWRAYTSLQKGSRGVELSARNSCTLPLVHPAHWYLPEWSLCPLLGALIVAVAARGLLSITWLWWLGGLTLTGPTEL